MLALLKLGGSLITDKQAANAYREAKAQQAAQAIRALLDARPDLKLIIGHGSGSFGHVAASRYGTMNGVSTPDQWRGFAEVAFAAAELNHLITKTLRDADIPVLRLQPSASSQSANGKLERLALDPIQQALAHDLVPLIYGDVSFDTVRGGTINSTEALFFYLTRHLPVDVILILGDVDGVYDQKNRVIAHIRPSTFDQIAPALGGSAGTDVTGGMRDKVESMLALVRERPSVQIRIFNELEPDKLTRALDTHTEFGTLITADD